MAELPTLSAVLVAAGSSRRMGFDKILTPIAGEPLIRHSARAFDLCADVSNIIVVCSKENEERIREALGEVRKVPAFVAGGKSRQESVRNGLEAVTTDFVAVHDAARPLVTPSFVSRCFEAAIEHGAAVAAEPVTDTLQRADESGFTDGTIDRAGLWRMQTPQTFRTNDLRRACRSALEAEVETTDETTAFARNGGKVFLVENPDWNFKVTVPRDVALVEFILQQRASASLT